MTLWTVACQASPSVGVCRQEYWSGLPCPPPGDLPDPRTEPMSPASPALVGGFFTTEPLGKPLANFSPVQFSSVAQSCPTLGNPMNRSTPGLPVHHHLPEFTQTRVHWVSDAIQPSHPRSSPSPPAPNPSQHQSLFQWVNSSHEVAKVLECKIGFRQVYFLPNLLRMKLGYWPKGDDCTLIKDRIESNFFTP